MILRRVTDPREWDAAVSLLPTAHFLQSWEWGEIKSGSGWTADRFAWEDSGMGIRAAGQVLTREVRLGPVRAAVLYLPKGPMLDWGDADLRARVLADLETLARQRRALQLKLDPDLPLGFGVPDSADDRPAPDGMQTVSQLAGRGWIHSREQIQFPNTVTLDITGEESAILARMKQKTRYNIRLAERHGVRVRPLADADLPMLYSMYAETADRDGFIIRPESYYLRMWSILMRAGMAQPLAAEVDGSAVAGMTIFRFGPTAWYMHGMSRGLHREKMPNHLLQWEAIRWARSQGCTGYDFWGAPSRFEPTDPMWGVFSFKMGFGAEVVRHVGAWDFAPSRPAYWAYGFLLPQILKWMRPFARRRARALAAAQGSDT